MLATTGAYQAMQESQELVPDFRVTIALPVPTLLLPLYPGGIYPDVTLGVKKLEVDMSTVSDLPDQSRYQVGYTAAECTFTLAGLVDQRDETKTAAWLFGKYPTVASDGSVSPLYQQFVEMSPVTVDMGLQPDGAGGVSELLRKFTGYVAYYQENDDGTVDFTCVDFRTLFKSVVSTLPVVTAAPFNAGLTSEFAVDMLCRSATAGTISSWPARRANCVLAAGFRTSLWPEVGTLDTSSTQPSVTFLPGINGSALATQFQAGAGWTAATYQLASAVTTRVYIEFDATYFSHSAPGFVISVGGTGADDGYLTVYQDANAFAQPILLVKLGTTATSFALPSTSAHFELFLTLPAVGANTASGTLSINGVVTTLTSIGGFGANRAEANWTRAAVTAKTYSTVEGLQITTEASPLTHYPFTPRAVLDPSLNPLTVIPATDGDPWQVIQQIADAEFAIAGFDESGTFRFTNRTTVRGRQPARTITSAVALKAVGVESTAAGVINRAQIPYTLYSFATAATTLWSLDAPTKVPRGQTITLTATVDTLFANLDATIAKLPNGSTDTANSYYRASNESAGITEHAGVSFGAITQTAADQLTITITNTTARDAWLVSPANYTDVTAGTPLLRLAGKQVTASDQLAADYQYPPVSAGGAASTRWGEVAYQPGTNPWIQDADTATGLAQDVVIDSCLPRPNLTGVSIVPDPRLQLIDVAHVVDTDRTGVDEYARIFMWNITYEAAGESGGDATYDMTIDARTLADPGGWVMGIAGRSEIGSTAYVYPCT